MVANKKYTSSAELQDFWTNNIAPNYFDFENVNNYRAGLFGYVNEVMSTITMDAHSALNIARREFYPVSAQNAQSIYKMAALQKIGLPVATAASCDAILLLNQDEVLNNSTEKNGIRTCVIDNTVSIAADNIPFSLLYPIVIVSKNTNGVWSHTIHYDKSITNDLDTDISANYYITNKTINQDGKRYILLAVNLKQLKRESITQLITMNSAVKTVSLSFPFEGELAGFEVFYYEEADSTPIQLKKIMQGNGTSESPFCQYRLLGDNKLEITFPNNIYFTPALNSEIRLDVYTSLGKDGEFPTFNGSLACSMESEQYPYNNNMSMIGVVNGSCTGGVNKPNMEAYTQKVQDAYSTNGTFTTSNDLQVKFNSISKNSNNMVKFQKRRADIMYRQYGAFILLKDENGNVVPTNTLNAKMTLDEFDSQNGVDQSAFIKPGTLFTYEEDGYTIKKIDPEELVLGDDLDSYEGAEFIYTSPFLISVSLNPNLIGYYCNSIDEIKSVEYSYINDESITQFIGSNLSIYRNAIAGENFYKISMTISPTSEIDPSEVIITPTIDDEDYYFRAEKNGKVTSLLYEEDSVVCNITYDDGDTDSFIVGSSVAYNEEGYEYRSGYSMNVNVYDTFVEGDILATKKVKDLGKIRACVELKDILYVNELYIPMVIEDYNEELNTYQLCAYISTDDIMDDDSILIDHGIYGLSGGEDDNVNIPFSNLKICVSVFYKYDESNSIHKYSKFDYFRTHTMTNTYEENSENGVSLISHIDFIRSTLTYEELEDSSDEDGINEDGFVINIKEIPLAKAAWIKNTSNFRYLINEVSDDFEILKDAFYSLENNYGIDMKFYNTYGKSKFFRTGIRDNWNPLSRVDCSFKFGVCLSSINTQASFLEQFRDYLKEKVESINSTLGNQSIYIMGLTSDIQRKFPEVEYMEYYGFNEHSYDTQKIEPIPTNEMDPTLKTAYIPEFINIRSNVENGENIPDISVEFLNTLEE